MDEAANFRGPSQTAQCASLIRPTAQLQLLSTFLLPLRGPSVAPAAFAFGKRIRHCVRRDQGAAGRMM
jgi:hypothetical protein